MLIEKLCIFLAIVTFCHRQTLAQKSPTLVLPELVSTEQTEYSYTLSPDGKEAYFVRRTSFYQSSPGIIYRTVFKDGQWTTPDIAPFSGQYADSSPFISPDGQRLFFTSRRPVGGKEQDNSNIWYLEKMDSGWTVPVYLAEVASAKSEYGPSVDSVGNLYFGSYREEGEGWGDQWVSHFENGQYQPPKNLGKAINTPGGEWSGCISPDGNTFIFEASGRDVNFSESGDLFISFRQNGQWTTARHLGDLNSLGSDLTPKISADGKTLYFASNRHPDIQVVMRNDDVDIYQISMEMLSSYLK